MPLKLIIYLLYKINKYEIVVNWGQIIDYQYSCLKKGLNGIGIPDLIIVQNAKQNHCSIYSLDNHFNLMESILNIRLIDRQAAFKNKYGKRELTKHPVSFE
jgi:hypothetical protein